MADENGEMFRHQKQGGFTLLELLISLTIFSVIILVVFGAFRIGSRAWERGEQNIEINQQSRVALSFVRKQLTGLWFQKENSPGTRLRAFKGTSSAVHFITNVPMTPQKKSGNFFIRYEVIPSDIKGKNKLIANEMNTSDLLYSEISVDRFDYGEIESGEHKTIMDGFEQIDFSYLNIDEKMDVDENDLNEASGFEKAFLWKETWDPDSDVGYPTAIRISIKTDSNSAPIRLIIRSRVGKAI